METLFSPVVLGSSVITAFCIYYITKYRQLGPMKGPKGERDGLQEAMLDEMMQNGITNYDQLINIDNIRTADQIRTPYLDRVPFMGNIINYQAGLLNNLRTSYKVPSTTADQAIIGYYTPSRQELDSSERYNRDY